MFWRLNIFFKCETILRTLNPSSMTLIRRSAVVTCWFEISVFAEAAYEEDKVDQVGGDTDWTEFLQHKVEDVAQVDRAQDWGKAEKKLK